MSKLPIIIKFIAVIMLMSASSAQANDEWTEAQKNLLAIDTALLAVDWGQTRYGVASPDHVELNPIIGKNASNMRIGIYFGTCIIANAIIADMMPTEYRGLFLSGVLAVQFYATSKNYRAGVKIKF